MANPQVGSRKGSPPFPRRQMFILALCRITEPIAFMSIFPYVYYMVKDFGIAKNDQQIAVYAGMVTSAFAFAEFSAGVFWGRLSDRIGRKPVLLTGLGGTALSMIIFGFAPNLSVALLARALGGLLNGNIGVLQTTVAELVTVKEHQPRAYTIMPFVWCLGSILGPSLGGTLASPVKSYPSIFSPGTIWEKYPYLLPNLVCFVIVCIGTVIGILFLEETHAEKKHRRDVGLEVGKWILSKFRRSCSAFDSARGEKTLDLLETESLIGEETALPGYRTTDGSPRVPSTPLPERRSSIDLIRSYVAPGPKPAVTKAFTRGVIINIVSYGLLAYHTMTFDQMLPVFLSTPDPEIPMPAHLPFQFTGGFGLDPKKIGLIISAQGLYSMFSNVVLFPLVVRRVGALRLFRILAVSYPLLYIVTPYLVLLPDSLRMTCLYMIVIWKCTFATMAYPSNAILLTNSAPSLLLLGTINGVAASTASLGRAFGPTVSGILYSTGLKIGYSGLAWWCSALVTVIGAVVSFFATDSGGRMDEKADTAELDQESGESPYASGANHVALEEALASTDTLLISERRGSIVQ